MAATDMTPADTQAAHEAAIQHVMSSEDCRYEVLTYVCRMADAAKRLEQERDHARACYEKEARLLADILGALPPPDTTVKGKTYQFNPPPERAMLMLRAFRDALNAAIEQACKGE